MSQPLPSEIIEYERWAVWWQGSGPQRGDHIMALTPTGGYKYEMAYLGDQHHDDAGKLVAAHNAAIDKARGETA